MPNPKIQLRLSEDLDLILALCRHFAAQVLDDAANCLKAEELAAQIQEHILEDGFVLEVLVDDQPAGVFAFKRLAQGKYEVHTLLRENCRGATALRAGRMGLAFLFNTKRVDALFSLCPESLPAAYLYARRLGFRLAGFSAQKWVQNKIECAVRVVKLTRKDYLCQ